MKKLLTLLFAFASAIFCLNVLSCSNSVDDMLDEYNGNFAVKIAEKSLPNVNSADFTQTELIPDETYILNTNCDFKIYAPLGGKSYTWKMEYKVDENTTVSVKNISSEERAFYVSVGSAGNFELYEPYTLSVVVINQNDVVLEDSAEVWILPEN